MEDIFVTISNNIESILLILIMSFSCFSVVLFSLIIISRLQKVRKQKLYDRYLVIVKKVLFSVLFEDKVYADFRKSPLYRPLFRKVFFRELLINEGIILHQNFGGEAATILETFYFQSHLIQDSFKKLKSRKWEVKCKGIEELAEMNVSKVFDVLIKISKTKHKTLKLVALKACIKLNGTNGLLHLIDHKDYIDEWTQISIVESLKKNDVNDYQEVEKLFVSNNKSVVMLAIKISQSLHLTNNLTKMKSLKGTLAQDGLLSQLEESISSLEVKKNV